MRSQSPGGWISTKASLLSAEAEAIAGPGLYAGVNASLVRAEAKLGNVVGGSFDVNARTGAGVRNGNVEAHVLGFGGKVGTDGVEINTPLGGLSVPVLGAPINWIGGLFR